MKGIEYYYREFELILEQWDRDQAQRFRQYADNHAPNYVYLWLVEKQKDDGFPKEIVELMKRFFWEIW
ncbi:hypothetical protein [Silvimonas soli]|uniref:hypothetical protein n=1 Tax=Silvimonas soli TaxID=2980100 RepID=UPI0024B379D3|nr:hypothetical protein [Silvimonas soli]